MNKKQNIIKELFGAIPFKKNTVTLLKEIREELKGKYL